MNDIVVNIQGLYKTINGQTILNNINLKVKKGKIYGIVGRNGSGKSMLFKVISGLIPPTLGKIEVFGEEISAGKFPRNFGVLLDKPGFLPNYTAFKNLKLLASIKNVATDDDIKKAIELVGLDPDDKKPVKKYSLGMKQRLGIAQSIMENPQLLILDEPMNGLDEQGVSDIRNLILKFKEQGVTVLLSSHNSEDINLLCDAVYEMDRGVLKARDYSPSIRSLN